MKISEHYEVDMNTHILNYMLAYTYGVVLTHTHLILLSSLTLSFSLSSSLLLSLLSKLFYNLIYFLFVYLFYAFVYKFIYVYNKQGEEIRTQLLGNNDILYGIHLYCSEAVSRVIMQGLFHDHVKQQLL